MKKIFVTLLVALCTLGIAAAQDLEKANEIYNNAVAEKDNNKVEAIKLFEQALELANQLGEEGAEISNQCKAIIPNLYLSLGTEFYNEKVFDEALANFEKAVEKGEAFDNADVVSDAKKKISTTLLVSSNQALQKKDFEKALVASQKLIDADPTNGQAFIFKGLALVGQGNDDEAIKAFELASENGKEEEAAKLLSNVYSRKAQAAQKAKNWKSALELAQKSTQYVDNAKAERIIGLSALSLKQNKVAADGFKAYLSMSPNAPDKTDITYQLGIALVGTGETAEACGYFKQIAQDPKWGEAARYQITTLKCN